MCAVVPHVNVYINTQKRSFLAVTRVLGGDVCTFTSSMAGLILFRMSVRGTVFEGFLHILLLCM